VPTPSKSRTPPPKPSEACRSGPDPCESDTTSGAIYVVPPGIVLLLASSGLARRSRRRGR
jgi:hypothetical protein